MPDAQTVQPADTLAFLLGTWSLERSIEDHRSSTTGLFAGIATLIEAVGPTGKPFGEHARYEETGELKFGTQVTRASRSLLYERLDDASIMLRFTNGRPFVDLNLGSGEWQSVHPCGVDLYEMSTTVCSDTVVEERWRVSGPTKNYVAVTTLTRIG